MTDTVPPSARQHEIRIGASVRGATHRPLLEQEEWRSVCGFRRDLVQGSEDLGVSFHYIRVFDSREHRHARATEFCVCMKGSGSISLDGRAVHMRPGDTVVVPPGVWHTYFPDECSQFHVMVVVTPGVRPEEDDIEFRDRNSAR